MTVLVVTGTGTGVGKTIATAALTAVDGDKGTKKLLLEIPEFLLARSS